MARTRITHSLLPAATRCCCCCHRLGLPGGGPGGMHPHHPLPAPHHHHLLLLSQAGSSRGWTWRHAPASPSPCSPPPPPAAAVTGWVFQGVGLEKRTRVISPTYPGFGASQSNNGRTFMSFGEDVNELLDHLQVGGGWA